MRLHRGGGESLASGDAFPIRSLLIAPKKGTKNGRARAEAATDDVDGGNWAVTTGARYIIQLTPINATKRVAARSEIRHFACERARMLP